MTNRKIKGRKPGKAEIATTQMQDSMSKWIKSFDTTLVTSEKIQGWLAKETSAVRVIQDKNHAPRDANSFGHMPASQIPFLKYVYSLDKPNVIELGCADGRMVWKTLLAGGIVFANDLHVNQIVRVEKFVRANLPHKIDFLITDAGDAVTIIERHPSIKESFDIVLSQNLIHYLTPSDYENFIQTTYNLLKPGGKLYLTGQHIYTHISMLYNNYLVASPEHKPLIQNIIRDAVIPDMQSHGSSGHYFLKSDENYGYVPASEADINRKGLIIAFNSNFMIASLKNLGFQIENYMCLSATGEKTRCYDDLTEAKEKAFEQNDKTFFNSNFISVEAIKPLGTDSMHVDDEL